MVATGEAAEDESICFVLPPDEGGGEEVECSFRPAREGGDPAPREASKLRSVATILKGMRSRRFVRKNRKTASKPTGKSASKLLGKSARSLAGGATAAEEPAAAREGGEEETILTTLRRADSIADFKDEPSVAIESPPSGVDLDDLVAAADCIDDAGRASPAELTRSSTCPGKWRSLRGWDDEDASHDDVSFIERELLGLSKEAAMGGAGLFRCEEGQGADEAAEGADGKPTDREGNTKSEGEAEPSAEEGGCFELLGMGSASRDDDGRDGAPGEGADDADLGEWLAPLANCFTDLDQEDAGPTGSEEERRDDVEAGGGSGVRRSQSLGSKSAS